MIENICTFRCKDRRRLVEVIDTVCAESPFMMTRRFEPTPAWEHALIEPDCPDHRLLVVKVGGRLAGWCRIFPVACDRSFPTAELGIGVLSAYRNQGLGTELVVRALNWAREAGLHEVRLTTSLDNQCALHVFRRSGFTAVGSPVGGRLEMACGLV